jgi:hypothetical protein
MDKRRIANKVAANFILENAADAEDLGVFARRAAEDGWEPVKNNPKRQRKKKPGGGYSYRDTPGKGKGKGEDKGKKSLSPKQFEKAIKQNGIEMMEALTQAEGFFKPEHLEQAKAWVKEFKEKGSLSEQPAGGKDDEGKGDEGKGDADKAQAEAMQKATEAQAEAKKMVKSPNFKDLPNKEKAIYQNWANWDVKDLAKSIADHGEPDFMKKKKEAPEKVTPKKDDAAGEKEALFDVMGQDDDITTLSEPDKKKYQSLVDDAKATIKEIEQSGPAGSEPDAAKHKQKKKEFQDNLDAIKKLIDEGETGYFDSDDAPKSKPADKATINKAVSNLVEKESGSDPSDALTKMISTIPEKKMRDYLMPAGRGSLRPGGLVWEGKRDGYAEFCRCRSSQGIPQS